MMADTKNSRIKIVLILVVTALIVAYVYLVAPYFFGKIDELRADNKQMEYDIKEIDRLSSDKETMREDIDTAREQLAEFEKRTEVDGSNFDMDISAKADKANVKINEIVVEDRSIIREKNKSGSILYLQPLSVMITGNVHDGIKFLGLLEKSKTGIYIIRDFTYTQGSDDVEESWMVSVDVYYYEKNVE